MNAPIIRGSQPPLSVAPPVEELPSLRAIYIKDYTGRVITEFEGSTKAWMRQFEGNPPRRVASIRTKS